MFENDGCWLSMNWETDMNLLIACRDLNLNTKEMILNN